MTTKPIAHWVRDLGGRSHHIELSEDGKLSVWMQYQGARYDYRTVTSDSPVEQLDELFTRNGYKRKEQPNA